jgi:uncharacterized cofD-like protein
MRKIVCIGGGTGLSTLLRGLKTYYEPTAIVTMADSGGHSGRLRDELGVLPPGDVRACLVALADDNKAKILRDLFSYRFLNGSHSGTNIGNLLLAALSDILGDFNQAVDAAHELLGLKGYVVPVTLEPTDLLAELKDGTILFGEKAIDLPRKNGEVGIKRIWLQPKVPANPRALQAIQEAAAIVFGPGDLYTSLLPNLYVDGVGLAIKQSKAKLIYVANIMTKHGETDNYCADDFVKVLESKIGRPIDYVLYNTEEIPSELLIQYEHEKAIPVRVKHQRDNWYGVPVLTTGGGLARHDSDQLAQALNQLIEQIDFTIQAVPVLPPKLQEAHI